jgi:hypothetical protein
MALNPRFLQTKQTSAKRDIRGYPILATVWLSRCLRRVEAALVGATRRPCRYVFPLSPQGKGQVRGHPGVPEM